MEALVHFTSESLLRPETLQARSSMLYGEAGGQPLSYTFFERNLPTSNLVRGNGEELHSHVHVTCYRKYVNMIVV